jgi:MFS family permease
VNEPDATTAVRRGPLAVGLVLATTLIAFEVTAVITALPTVSDELGGDSLYGATLAAYTLANIVSLVAVGGLIDSRGPRTPYAYSLMLFTIGLIIASVAPSMWVVLIGRLVQGIGSGGLVPVAYAVVNRMWATHEQARIFAWISAGWVLPSLLAPGLAGWITTAIGWRWVFMSVIPLVIATAAMVLPAMSHPSLTGTGAHSDVDNRGRLGLAMQVALGIGGLALGLQASVAWIGVPVAIAGAFVGVRAWRRLSPPGVIRARHGLPAIIACRILATAAFLGVDSFVPLAADRIHGASATAQGFVIIGAAVTWSIG